MSSATNFVIENGCLIKYFGSEKKVTIPEGVTCIADYAFKGHREIWEIEFPSTLQKIGSGDSVCTCGVFDGCYGLSLGKDFTIFNDCLFYSKLCEMENVIPEGVTAIHTGAVRIPEDEVPRTVIVPKTVEEVGQWAFSNAYVRFEGAIPKTIGTGSMFRSIPKDCYCDGYYIDKGVLLKRIYTNAPIPTSVKRIATGAIVLKNGERLEIPDSVEVIDHDAINAANNTIAEVIVPSSVKVIEDNQETLPSTAKITLIGMSKSCVKAFAKNNKCKFVSMDKGVPPLEIWRIKKRRDNTAELVAYFGNETDVVIPEDIGGYAITDIGDSLFISHTEIREVVVPKGIKTIGVSSFGGCKNLHTINIPESVDFVSWHAFQDSGLTAVVIPSSVESIGRYAFCMSQLSSVTLSDGLRLIGAKAFAETQPINKIVVPATVTEIQDEAFNTLIKEISILGEPKLGEKVFKHATIVRGKPNGYVEQYCRKNGYAFKPL